MSAAAGAGRSPRLALLHTAALHEARFARLHAEHCADLPLLQRSEPSLLALALAREQGAGAPPVAAAVASACRALVDAGASTLLCTCSTIGELAESASARVGVPVLRVDRAMAAEAVARAGRARGRIVLLITIESTRLPSQRLIEEEAARAGLPIALEVTFIEGAFEAALCGDAARANALVAERLQALAAAGRSDVAVLAQVSMADARPSSGAVGGLPVLASPALGLRAAARRCRGA